MGEGGPIHRLPRGGAGRCFLQILNGLREHDRGWRVTSDVLRVTASPTGQWGDSGAAGQRTWESLPRRWQRACPQQFTVCEERSLQLSHSIWAPQAPGEAGAVISGW